MELSSQGKGITSWDNADGITSVADVAQANADPKKRAPSLDRNAACTVCLAIHRSNDNGGEVPKNTACSCGQQRRGSEFTGFEGSGDAIEGSGDAEA